MRSHLAILAAALLAAGPLARAAPPAAAASSVNLDGSVSAHSAKKPSLAANASRDLRANDVPSTVATPRSLKAAADADIASREQRARGPRLKVQRENLKEDEAARALAQRQTPANYDRSISMGDKDHTEQVTDLKVTIKK